MELSLKFFCLLFACLTPCSFACSSSSNSSNSSSSSSSGGLQKQLFSNLTFYCPADDKYKDRNKRCIKAKVCLETDGNETKCNPAGKNGGVDTYFFYRKKSNIRFLKVISSGRKKRAIEDYKHWFVEYRGFVYEFGKSYGFQELDVNDPNYKYGPGGEKVVDKETIVGESSCSRDDVLRFVKKWLNVNRKYHYRNNNCQDFAKALVAELGNNCPDRNGG